MKKFIIGVALAISLMVGIAGSAVASQPDNAACGAVGSQANAATALQVLIALGSCDAHGPA